MIYVIAKISKGSRLDGYVGPSFAIVEDAEAATPYPTISAALKVCAALDYADGAVPMPFELVTIRTPTRPTRLPAATLTGESS